MEAPKAFYVGENGAGRRWRVTDSHEPLPGVQPDQRFELRERAAGSNVIECVGDLGDGHWAEAVLLYLPELGVVEGVATDNGNFITILAEPRGADGRDRIHCQVVKPLFRGLERAGGWDAEDDGG